MKKRSGKLPKHLDDLEQSRYIQIENEVVYFCSPTSGKKVSDQRAPDFLLQDEVCSEGVTTLRELVAEKSVELHIFYNYHRGEEDFIALRQKAPELSSFAVVGLEWNSREGSAYPKRADDIAFADTTSGKGLARYIDLSCRWLADAGAVAVPSDIDTPTSGDDQLRVRLNDLLKLADPKDKDAPETVEEWERYHLVWSVYQYARQFLMPACFGYMAGRFKERLQSGGKLGLVIGSGHSFGVPRKLAQLGIPSVSHIVRPLDGDVDDRIICGYEGNGEEYGGAFFTGSVKLSDLRRVAELEVEKAARR